MPLTLNPGEVKTFQLQADSYKAYPRHWVGREYKPCSGPGCALCQAGVAVRTDYMMPVAIGGVSDSWVFSSGIAQQLDALTQKGYKLMGLMIKVSRAGSGRDTRYTVEMVASPAPPVVVASASSQLSASSWAALMSRLLARKDFLDIVAGEIQAMKDEGLWQE